MKVYVDFTNHIVCSEYDFVDVLRNDEAFKDFFANDWVDAGEFDEEEIDGIDNFDDLDLDFYERKDIIEQSCRNFLHQRCECFEVDGDSSAMRML